MRLIVATNRAFSRWFGFDATSVHGNFVVDKVALGEVFLPEFQLSPVSIIPPLLHTHSFIYQTRCVMFLSQYFSFPLSVSLPNVPYSYIRQQVPCHLVTQRCYFGYQRVLDRTTLPFFSRFKQLIMKETNTL